MEPKNFGSRSSSPLYLAAFLSFVLFTFFRVPVFAKSEKENSISQNEILGKAVSPLPPVPTQTPTATGVSNLAPAQKSVAVNSPTASPKVLSPVPSPTSSMLSIEDMDPDDLMPTEQIIVERQSISKFKDIDLKVDVRPSPSPAPTDKTVQSVILTAQTSSAIPPEGAFLLFSSKDAGNKKEESLKWDFKGKSTLSMEIKDSKQSFTLFQVNKSGQSKSEDFLIVKKTVMVPKKLWLPRFQDPWGRFRFKFAYTPQYLDRTETITPDGEISSGFKLPGFDLIGFEAGFRGMWTPRIISEAELSFALRSVRNSSSAQTIAYGNLKFSSSYAFFEKGKFKLWAGPWFMSNIEGVVAVPYLVSTTFEYSTRINLLAGIKTEIDYFLNDLWRLRFQFEVGLPFFSTQVSPYSSQSRLGYFLSPSINIEKKWGDPESFRLSTFVGLGYTRIVESTVLQNPYSASVGYSINSFVSKIGIVLRLEKPRVKAKHGS